MLDRIRDTVRSGRRGEAFNQDLRDELEHHLAERAADLERRGMGAEEALRRARLELGANAAKVEECREARGLRWPDELRRNAVFAVRQLWKHPVFALTSVLTLGLCIGVNTAIFSAVDGVLLKPLAYPDVERLALLAVHLEGGGAEDNRLSHDARQWEVIRDHADAIDAAVIKTSSSGRNLAVGEQAEFVQEQRVGTGFFRVLGVPPLVGREFTEEEDRPNGPAVAVLSYGLAEHLFEKADAAVGRTIRLKGEPHTVVGVTRPDFVSSAPADVWTPLRPSRNGEGSGSNYQILARTRNGLPLEEAELALSPLLEEIFDVSRLNTHGVEIKARLRLTPLQEGLTSNQDGSLKLLWAAVAAVLLIGCVNLAGLLIARLEGRAQELAIRRSLGGGRGAVARQLLTESIVIGVCGGAAGLGFARASLSGLEELLREGFHVWRPIELDLRVLGMTAAVSIGCGLLLGLYPAWRGSRMDLKPVLDRAGRSVSGGARWPRRALVAAQSAACLLLLAGAGLLIQNFERLRDLDPGFNPAGVVTGAVSLADARYDSAASMEQLFSGVLERLRQAPGVTAAGVAQSLPYERNVNLGFQIVGEEEQPGYRPTDVVYVSGEYFEALEIPLLQGRRPRGTDTAEAQPVVVVNSAFVERNLAGRDVLTTSVRLEGRDWRIAGVVGNVQQETNWDRSGGPLSPVPTVFVPVAQSEDGVLQLVNVWSTPSFVVRSQMGPAQTIRRLQEAAAAVDPMLPFAGFRTMAEVQGDSWASQRVQATLLGVLAALALGLAAVGIYGLIASMVTERRREAAIRMALGAAASQTVRAVALPGFVLAAVGVSVGLAAAPLAGRLVESLLWGVEPGDPLALGGGAVVLLGAAAVASLLPALQLLRVSPGVLLRES